MKKQEGTYKAMSGYLMFSILLITMLAAIFTFITGLVWLGIPLFLAVILISIGFTVVNPNESSVLILFGAYKGTIKTNGLFWVKPLR